MTEIGFLFVCLLSSAFLQSFHYCSFRNDFDLIFQVFSGHFQLNFLKFTLFVKLFSSLFKIFFVCLFVKLFSSFLPPSRQTNDNFGIFFFKFSRHFTLVPWQKVGRIGLGFAGNHSNFTGFLLSFFPCIRTI